MAKKCMIVDDEPAAHYVLINYIKQNPQLELVHQCYNGIEALTILREKEIDLMFLDIDMPEITGLELLQTLQVYPKTILTTAYSKFALESYEYGVIDYLLKPIYYPRFIKSIERFFALEQAPKSTPVTDTISVKVDGVVMDIVCSHILYAQSYGNYVKIFTREKVYLASITTNQLEELLPDNLFKRVHKSFIVAINEVQNITRDSLVLGTEKIPVGITYRRSLQPMIK